MLKNANLFNEDSEEMTMFSFTIQNVVSLEIYNFQLLRRHRQKCPGEWTEGL